MKLNVRQITIGSKVELEVECPECGKWLPTTDEQLHGKSDIECSCGKFKESVDISTPLEKGDYKMGHADGNANVCPVCKGNQFEPYVIPVEIPDGAPLPQGMILKPGQRPIINELLFMTCLNCGVCFRPKRPPMPQGEGNEHSNDPASPLSLDG